MPIATWSQGFTDDNMDERILVELHELVIAHPWWTSRTRLVLRLLADLGVTPPASILDAGCGWGSTLFGLEGAGYKVTGADISRRTLERLDTPARQLAECDLTKPQPTGGPSFDAALALDVIEHIDDDAGALRTLASFVRPGGKVIVSVPALPELTSEFDEVQGHRRRYLPETLGAAFRGADIRLDETIWWGQWMVPVLSKRKSKRRAKPGETADQVYIRYLRLPRWPATSLLRFLFARDEKRTLARRNTTGTSLIAIGTRA